jgi:hypothetical protein
LMDQLREPVLADVEVWKLAALAAIIGPRR